MVMKVMTRNFVCCYCCCCESACVVESTEKIESFRSFWTAKRHCDDYYSDAVAVAVVAVGTRTTGAWSLWDFVPFGRRGDVYVIIGCLHVCRGSCSLICTVVCFGWCDDFCFGGFVLLRSPNFRRRPVWAQKKKWFVPDRFLVVISCCCVDVVGFFVGGMAIVHLRAVWDKRDGGELHTDFAQRFQDFSRFVRPPRA